MVYKCGQEVFRDPEPFSYIVIPKYRKIVCDWCLKMCESEGILKACAKCNWVYYCDQTCQKEAWKSHHKLECKYLQNQNMTENLKEIFSTDFHTYQEVFLRLLKTTLKLNKNGKEEFFQLPNGKKRYFANLMSNAEELRKQKEQNDMFETYQFMYTDFQIWLGDTLPIPSFTEFFEIIGKWHTNSTSIVAVNFDKPYEAVACGLYLGYSGLDHSCAPNAVWVNHGKVMVVRTIEDVENFSDVRITYFDACDKTEERKDYLRENYFFNCKCVKCEDPNSDAKFSSLKCKSCSGWVHESTRICSDCNQTLKLSHEELTIVKKYKNGTLPKCEPTMTIQEIRSILEEYIKVFHDYHEIYRTFEKVLEFPKIVSQSQNGNHDAMLLLLEMRKLRLDHYSGHLQQFCQDIVLLHLHISNACKELKLLNEAEFHLKKVEEVMKMTLGEDHPYMQECQKSIVDLEFARLALK